MEQLDSIRPVDVWYVVGIITSDGNLSKDGRHINITMNDVNLLLDIKRALSLKNKISYKQSGYKQGSYCSYIQFGSVEFYQFLNGVGLTPNKSLSLGKLKIEKKYFVDFLRGVIDGDGCIRRWMHPTNKTEQWALEVTSYAKVFSEWLYYEISEQFMVRGAIFQRIDKRRNKKAYDIKFGKMAAREILTACYYKNYLALSRKAKLAQECISSYRGWTKSFTVKNICRDGGIGRRYGLKTR